MLQRIFKRLSSARIVAIGFIAIIFIGSGLLMLPVSLKNPGSLHYIDALYTSTSAVCVTGLLSIEAGDTFSTVGQFILGLLIQIGGLGVTSVGAGVILAMRKKVNLKGRAIIKDAMNLDSGKGVVKFVQSVFLTTLAFEAAGAVLTFFVFIRDYPPARAIGLSFFHSIAAFNNSGIDILGGGRSLSGYQDNVYFNIITILLIIFGGIGFLLIREVIDKKFCWRRFSMHTKVVLSMSAGLIIAGALLLILTENISVLGAFFQSVSARTAGFYTYPLGKFTNAGRIVMIVLMFIGASPGSTGGGIKTTTFFVLLQGIKSAATNRSEKAFRYSVPVNAFRKASVILLMGLTIVLTGSFVMSALEPGIDMSDILFEITSAFGTTGLSTGITGSLTTGSKILSIIIMYIGRLGPLTIANLWYFDKGERVSFPDGNISIG